jgi:hypothetical protein
MTNLTETSLFSNLTSETSSSSNFSDFANTTSGNETAQVNQFEVTVSQYFELLVHIHISYSRKLFQNKIIKDAFKKPGFLYWILHLIYTFDENTA